jgi:hypothetical protein
MLKLCEQFVPGFRGCMFGLAGKRSKHCHAWAHLQG